MGSLLHPVLLVTIFPSINVFFAGDSIDNDGKQSRILPVARSIARHCASRETIQHPLLLHCTALHSTPHGIGFPEIDKYSWFFKAPNLIAYVLPCPMHVKQVVSEDLLATAATAAMVTMATWITGEKNAMLPGTLKVKKHSCDVPYWKNGEPNFWHYGERPKVFPSDSSLVTCRLQYWNCTKFHCKASTMCTLIWRILHSKILRKQLSSAIALPCQ